jgi:hypothetical protein
MARFQTLNVNGTLSVGTTPDMSTAGNLWYNTTTCRLNLSYNYDGWVAQGALINTRMSLMGAGSATSALAFGGYNSQGISTYCTETYNGTSWSDRGYFNGTVAYGGAGTGVSNTDAIVFGGGNYTGKFDGTSWSSAFGSQLTSGRLFLAGIGTSTSALAFGGCISYARSCTEAYNGTSWSTCNAMITARCFLAGAGSNPSSALAFGGASIGGSSVSCTEVYNGTSWSTGGALINARQALTGAGISTSAVAMGGGSCTEKYNGTSWSSTSATIFPVQQNARAGSQNSALTFGGFRLDNNQQTNCTQNFYGILVCTV